MQTGVSIGWTSRVGVVNGAKYYSIELYAASLRFKTSEYKRRESRVEGRGSRVTTLDGLSREISDSEVKIEL